MEKRYRERLQFAMQKRCALIFHNTASAHFTFMRFQEHKNDVHVLTGTDKGLELQPTAFYFESFGFRCFQA
jgi:hypothetical protein